MQSSCLTPILPAGKLTAWWVYWVRAPTFMSPFVSYRMNQWPMSQQEKHLFYSGWIAALQESFPGLPRALHFSFISPLAFFPSPNLVWIVLKTDHKSNPKQRFIPFLGRGLQSSMKFRFFSSVLHNSTVTISGSWSTGLFQVRIVGKALRGRTPENKMISQKSWPAHFRLVIIYLFQSYKPALPNGVLRSMASNPRAGEQYQWPISCLP